MRWSELGIQTYREPAHPLLVRAGYVEPGGREFTALGQRLLARLFPGGVSRRTAPPGTRPRQKLLVAPEYLVALGADVPAALPTVADGERLLAETPHGDEAFGRCGACGHQGFEIGWPRSAAAPEPLEPLVEHHTPDCPGIDAVVAHFADRGLTAAQMLKCLALKDGSGGVVVALVPGDREVRLAPGMQPFADADFAHHPELVRGYIGPMGLQGRGVRVVADPSIAARPGPWTTGANRADHHVTGATLGRDFEVDALVPLATVAAGDPCPACGQPMDAVPAIEVRSVDGTVGASRVVQLLADRCRDDAGLVWPADAAPFATHLVTLRGVDGSAWDGDDVLWDDRDASPGVKFADADLIGLPSQVIAGPKSLARGVLERKDRATGARTEIPVADPRFLSP